MITRISNIKIISDGEITEKKSIYISDEKIIAVTNDPLPFDAEIDGEGNYASSGFIDLHIHGGAGYEFIDATRDAVINAANIHAIHGATTIYPTISAFDRTTTARALDAINGYRNDPELLPCILGAHLEGPYLSASQCGAQDTSYIRDPEPDEYEALVEKYGNIIKRWSYAPERPGADKFLEFLVKNGIVAAAAHTDATYSEMQKAYDGGCNLITHLYSCTSTVKRVGGFRKLGVTESAYLIDGIYAEAIGDGCHLPPELLRLLFKLKDNSHICLITDAIRFGGMENSENTTGGTENIPYIIEDGVAKLADRSAFAGSIATMDKVIRTCVKLADIPLTVAVSCATEVPAKIIGLKTKGKISAGFDADIVIFDDDINIKRVIVRGKAIN